MKEKTLIIIKPDAIKHSSEIWSIVLNAGFNIHKTKKVQFTHRQAQEFYLPDSNSKSLSKFIVSGECMIAILKKENAVKDLLKLIGDENPAKAKTGTIRALFGNAELYAKGIPANAVHGPDSTDIAELQISFLYNEFNGLLKKLF